jgi:hypothetical protein
MLLIPIALMSMLFIFNMTCAVLSWRDLKGFERITSVGFVLLGGMCLAAAIVMFTYL